MAQHQCMGNVTQTVRKLGLAVFASWCVHKQGAVDQNVHASQPELWKPQDHAPACPDCT